MEPRHPLYISGALPYSIFSLHRPSPSSCQAFPPSPRCLQLLRAHCHLAARRLNEP
ncbi:Hypothetical protein FKW44_005889 [Caligus rogercresseyi]|uniref:Uncharacterized protein n=1 Tax=Caligus rogercresseyi TaxID=217165 RepID=A0A7T8KCM5_CALRO|nr:Hypothetical protein FKW44_005889 [Caligus rogercresseyi]